MFFKYYDAKLLTRTDSTAPPKMLRVVGAFALYSNSTRSDCNSCYQTERVLDQCFRRTTINRIRRELLQTNRRSIEVSLPCNAWASKPSMSTNTTSGEPYFCVKLSIVIASTIWPTPSRETLPFRPSKKRSGRRIVCL